MPDLIPVTRIQVYFSFSKIGKAQIPILPLSSVPSVVEASCAKARRDVTIDAV